MPKETKISVVPDVAENTEEPAPEVPTPPKAPVQAPPQPQIRKTNTRLF